MEMRDNELTHEVTKMTNVTVFGTRNTTTLVLSHRTPAVSPTATAVNSVTRNCADSAAISMVVTQNANMAQKKSACANTA